MTEISLDIKGRIWKFILLTDRRYDKLHNNTDDGASVAITLGEIYEVHFRKSNWDLITIQHELAHVLFSMSLTSSADVTPSQVEEIFAEIIGNHCAEILVWTHRIAERFSKE